MASLFSILLVRTEDSVTEVERGSIQALFKSFMGAADCCGYLQANIFISRARQHACAYMKRAGVSCDLRFTATRNALSIMQADGFVTEVERGSVMLVKRAAAALICFVHRHSPRLFIQHVSCSLCRRMTSSRRWSGAAWKG